MTLERAFLAVSLAALASSASFSAAARDIDRVQSLSQGEFRLLSEDLGAGLSYKPLTPTAPLGTTGFDVGVAATSTRLEHRELFDRASGGDFGSRLNLPSVRLNKGLPAGFDAGVMLSGGGGTNVRLWGGELRYALVQGGPVMPAIGTRISHTKLNGVDQLDFETTGVDVSISKGFLMLTPYAGLGRVWIKSEPVAVATLSKESFSLPKRFVGLNFNLGFVNVALEGDRTGNASTYGLKAGFRF
jgi:opacity protein-like surface antigen